MPGDFIDHVRFSLKSMPTTWESGAQLVETDYGKIRVLDTAENKPVIINVPDGPNVIEHQLKLIRALSKNFRVICFEFPGIGCSYPNSRYDYSIDKASKLILNLMESLKVEQATLIFSCSNGFYAIKAAELFPDKIKHVFLSQTPSLHAMNEWNESAIPNVLKLPVIGQLANAFLEKKLANIWYKYALPKGTDLSEYQGIALHSLNTGGCFCLSGLVQGLKKELTTPLASLEVPTTLIWGSRDFTHRKTDPDTIKTHVPGCEVVTFDDSGHFPELEETDKYVALVNARTN